MSVSNTIDELILSNFGEYKKTKYLTFIKKRFKDKKTYNVEVYTRDESSKLGEIYWKSGWRTYVFEIKYSLFDIKCLKDITKYIQDLLDERKNGK